jgi:hypothetical protein
MLSDKMPCVIMTNVIRLGIDMLIVTLTSVLMLSAVMHHNSTQHYNTC